MLLGTEFLKPQSCALSEECMKKIVPLYLVASALSIGGSLVTRAATLELPEAARNHWTADNGNGTYSNPLFYEEFEDPDVIRVGEDYYLAGTTMHMMPALQIMHSKDLVNWELVGYCMDRLDLGPAGKRSGGRSAHPRGAWG